MSEAISTALTRIKEAREAHEAQHGKPDEYNGTTPSLYGGPNSLARLYAYNEDWYASMDRWSRAYNELFGS